MVVYYLTGKCRLFVNIVCLCLQYSFAKEYYDKYCGCFGKCWRSILTSKAEKAMEKRYSEMMEKHKNAHVSVQSDEEADDEQVEIKNCKKDNDMELPPNNRHISTPL